MMLAMWAVHLAEGKDPGACRAHDDVKSLDSLRPGLSWRTYQIWVQITVLIKFSLDEVRN